MKTKPKLLTVKTRSPFMERLKTAADVLGKDMSAIVRDAVDEKLTRLEKVNPRLADALAEVDRAA